MKSKPHKKPIKNHFRKPAAAENPSDYAFKITETAVLQICQSLGFKTTQLSALETLTHVATLCLQILAKRAVSYSIASNRTQANIFDIINSLHDMSSVRGFTGGSTLHCNSCGMSLLRSSVLKNIKSFVEFSDEIPFARPIPRGKSISLRRNSIPLDLDELDSRGLHIPRWLPRCPDDSYNKCGDRREKKREGEVVLWEKSDLVGGGNEFKGISRENKNRSGGGGDLSVERGRVRFMIGKVEDTKRRVLISLLVERGRVRFMIGKVEDTKRRVLISLLPSACGRI